MITAARRAITAAERPDEANEADEPNVPSQIVTSATSHPNETPSVTGWK